MSVTASIRLRIEYNHDLKKQINRTAIIQMLLNYGWKSTRNGYAEYLPLGNKDDDFSWTHEKMNPEELMVRLKQKEDNDELIGVFLTWQNTQIGGNLLFLKNSIYTMSFSIDANRQLLIDNNDYKITDVNWYLTKLLPALNQSDFVVRAIQYDEF